MAERLSRVEIFKDAAQDIVESGASTVGEVAFQNGFGAVDLVNPVLGRHEIFLS